MLPLVATDVVERTAHLFARNPSPKARIKMVTEYTYAELWALARKCSCTERFSPEFMDELRLLKQLSS